MTKLQWSRHDRKWFTLSQNEKFMMLRWTGSFTYGSSRSSYTQIVFLSFVKWNMAQNVIYVHGRYALYMARIMKGLAGGCENNLTQWTPVLFAINLSFIINDRKCRFKGFIAYYHNPFLSSIVCSSTSHNKYMY